MTGRAPGFPLLPSGRARPVPFAQAKAPRVLPGGFRVLVCWFVLVLTFYPSAGGPKHRISRSLPAP